MYHLHTMEKNPKNSGPTKPYKSSMFGLSCLKFGFKISGRCSKCSKFGVPMFEVFGILVFVPPLVKTKNFHIFKVGSHLPICYFCILDSPKDSSYKYLTSTLLTCMVKLGSGSLHQRLLILMMFCVCIFHKRIRNFAKYSDD